MRLGGCPDDDRAEDDEPEAKHRSYEPRLHEAERPGRLVEATRELLGASMPVGRQRETFSDSREAAYGRVAAHNAASAKVLTRAGFVEVGSETAFAPGVGADVVERVYRLDR